MKIGDGCYFKEFGIHYGRILNIDEDHAVILVDTYLNDGEDVDSIIKILPRDKVARTKEELDD